MTAETFNYDVALSFAGEDRPYVERVAGLLRARGIRVFYDSFETANLWGKDLYAYLDDIYRRRAQYTIIFVSQHYARKLWTSHERRSAQARALAESREYVLPVRFDNTEVPGLSPATGYLDATTLSPSELVELVAAKLQHPEVSLPPPPAISTGPGIDEPIQIPRHPPAVAVDEADPLGLPLLLYSVNTTLAFLINEHYYGQRHYAWCTPFFDMRRSQASTFGNAPASANPFEIYGALLRDIRTRDRHSALIAQNKAGIRRGATARLQRAQISQAAATEIEQVVAMSEISDYVPLIYVIPTSGVRAMVKAVPASERAHPLSREFIVEDLPRAKFDVINTEDRLP